MIKRILAESIFLCGVEKKKCKCLKFTTLDLYMYENKMYICNLNFPAFRVEVVTMLHSIRESKIRGYDE